MSHQLLFWLPKLASRALSHNSVFLSNPQYVVAYADSHQPEGLSIFFSKMGGKKIVK